MLLTSLCSAFDVLEKDSHTIRPPENVFLWSIWLNSVQKCPGPSSNSASTLAYYRSLRAPLKLKKPSFKHSETLWNFHLILANFDLFS